MAIQVKLSVVCLFNSRQIRGLPKDWRIRPGRSRHTWLWTLEADLQPLNHGLNSAWRHAKDRGRWKQLVETAIRSSQGHDRDDDDDDDDEMS